MTTTYTKYYQLAKPDFRTEPWAGYLQSNFDKIDNMLEAALSVKRGGDKWGNGYLYNIGDTAFDIDSYPITLYACVMQHTSDLSSTFAQDRLANPAYWRAVTSASDLPFTNYIGNQRFTSTTVQNALYEAASIPIVASNISGMQLNTDGSTNFGVTVGKCVDNTGSVCFGIAGSTLGKTADSWYPGAYNGALDTGVVANGKFYYVYAMYRLGFGWVDVVISLQEDWSNVNKSRPGIGVYTMARYIGCMYYSGGGFVNIAQLFGNEFKWRTKIQDYTSLVLGTTLTWVPLTVPRNVFAKFKVCISSSTAGVKLLVVDGYDLSTVPDTPVGNFDLMTQVADNTKFVTGNFVRYSGYSYQIGLVASAANTFVRIITEGWIDQARNGDG